MLTKKQDQDLARIWRQAVCRFCTLWTGTVLMDLACAAAMMKVVFQGNTNPSLAFKIVVTTIALLAVLAIELALWAMLRSRHRRKN